MSKVTKPAFLARIWEWRVIGTDCPVFTLQIKGNPFFISQ